MCNKLFFVLWIFHFPQILHNSSKKLILFYNIGSSQRSDVTFWHFTVIEQKFGPSPISSPWLTSPHVSKAADKRIVFFAIDIIHIHITFSPIRVRKIGSRSIDLCDIAVINFGSEDTFQEFAISRITPRVSTRDIERSGTRYSSVRFLFHSSPSR